MIIFEEVKRAFNGNVEEGETFYTVTFENSFKEYNYRKASYTMELLAEKLDCVTEIARNNEEYKNYMLDKYTKEAQEVEARMDNRIKRMNDAEMEWTDCFKSQNVDSDTLRDLNNKISELKNIGQTKERYNLKGTTISNEQLKEIIYLKNMNDFESEEEKEEYLEQFNNWEIKFDKDFYIKGKKEGFTLINNSLNATLNYNLKWQGKEFKQYEEIARTIQQLFMNLSGKKVKEYLTNLAKVETYVA